MKRQMISLITLASFVIFSLSCYSTLCASPLRAMDNQGAEVMVTTKDGARTQGRLTAVKWNALIVEDGGTPPGNSDIIRSS